ncbi:hypothetical protein [Leptospira adleri]|uniref:Glycosyltransferase RgtA/B/C/D-like domain-containing protein n=1 Tax=Leptospira adleri TaxID=2023186 RepID=A0A2M9YUV8_9LEPT|nr:hypothetical protein [Leptospira adleri]PJZ55327.1 hypothetical protein CH380_02145 [Leptospira adleri]PJZ59772.1 hypothetical protein CH376_22030 [Leptospira adleri]
MNSIVFSRSYWGADQFIILGLFLILFVIEKKFIISPKVRFLLTSLLSISLTVYLFGPNLKAQWWLIDDHEVFYFLKSKTNQNSWSDLFDILLNQTEVGKFGNSSRYRVSYYFLRISESLLWKDKATLWYLFRLSISSLFIFSILGLLSKFFSFSLSFLFTMYVFTVRYWSDIFSRMATGELYTVWGVALIILALSKYRFGTDKKNPIWVYLCISFGVMISAGSKENFLILILLPIFILFFERHKSGIWFQRIVLIFPILFSIFEVISLLLFHSKNKTDIYGNSTSFADRSAVLLGAVKSEYVMIPLGLLIVLCSLRLSASNRIKIRDLKKILLPAVFVLVVLLNIIFYNGNWPINTRYDFPGLILFQSAVFLILALTLSEIFKIFKFGVSKRNVAVQLILILYVSSIFSVQGLTNLQRDSRANMKRTISFTASVKKVSSLPKDEMLILYAYQAYDYEPIDSFSRYLNYYDSEISKMILVTDQEAESEFKNGLLRSLRIISKEGSAEMKVLPYDEKSIRGKSCTVIIFPPAALENAPDIRGCRNLRKELVVY